MLQRSRPKKRQIAPSTKRVRVPRASSRGEDQVHGFLEAFAQLVPTTKWAVLPRRRGCAPRVPLTCVVQALVFHLVHRFGTLGEHFALLFEDALNDSSSSERRTGLPWHVFADLMRCALRPLARARRDKGCFWRGWRLVAVDGTQHSVSNTPQNNAALPKAKSRRGRAAFAKIVTSVLLEVGLHNPLAAAIGHDGRSEWELTRSLLAQLPKQALLLADRLHGCAAFVAQVLEACERVGSRFLIRARSNIKARTLRRFKDGSRLVSVPVYAKGSRKVLKQITLREIRIRVTRPGHRAQLLRLWTNLLDPAEAPALELAELYARRWEHELYYREIKRVLRKNELLNSHTVETAAQEIAALVLISAMLARERVRAAAGEVPALSISFAKSLELVRSLWTVFALGEDIIPEELKQELTERLYAHLRECTTPPKRNRSCPRKVRQPVSKWPRLIDNASHQGDISFRIL